MLVRNTFAAVAACAALALGATACNTDGRTSASVTPSSTPTARKRVPSTSSASSSPTKSATPTTSASPSPTPSPTATLPPGTDRLVMTDLGGQRFRIQFQRGTIGTHLDPGHRFQRLALNQCGYNPADEAMPFAFIVSAPSDSYPLWDLNITPVKGKVRMCTWEQSTGNVKITGPAGVLFDGSGNLSGGDTELYYGWFVAKRGTLKGATLKLSATGLAVSNTSGLKPVGGGYYSLRLVPIANK